MKPYGVCCRLRLRSQALALVNVQVACVTAVALAAVGKHLTTNGRFEMSATTVEYNALWGNVSEVGFSMPRCACVACNSCTCGCSCRRAPVVDVEDWPW